MIQWYPGHMEKAKKEIQSKLKLVDIVFELIDARIPMSSKNPMIDSLINNKPRLILVTKALLADEYLNRKWQDSFKMQNIYSLLIDSVSGLNINKIVSTAFEVLKDKIERDLKKGLQKRAIRAMVIGIPNVGKSTLINKLVNKKVANVGNRPGVTKAQQWIRINDDLELLDTPGVLWPKFEDVNQGYNLALTGAIKDDVYHHDDVILYFLDFLKLYYPHLLIQRYDVNVNDNNLLILEKIAKKQGYIKNNEVIYEKVYETILNDFRNNRIGRITLDRI